MDPVRKYTINDQMGSVTSSSSGMTVSPSQPSPPARLRAALRNDQGEQPVVDVTEDVDGWDAEAIADEAITEAEKKERDQLLSKVKFGEDIKILCIDSAPLRIICHHLGVTDVMHVKHVSSSYVALTGMMVFQVVDAYMKSSQYENLGELNFDEHGRIIPCGRKKWHLKKGEQNIIHTGSRFFKRNEEAICISHQWNPSAEQVIFQVYSKDESDARRIMTGIESYAKTHNCLRGEKIKDVHVGEATFSIVDPPKNLVYTWDKFYYPDQIKQLFDTDVFGFLDNVEKYNARHITKRGIMLHGPPGTGKTSVGHIICNYATDHTVIWITPDIIFENRRGVRDSVKSLYMLADYLSPVVIILEDMDLFCEDRDEHADTVTLGSLMNILDGVNTISNAITIATTNRFDFIEKALRNRPGRFDRIAELPVMNDVLRLKMFTDRLVDCKIDEPTIQYLVSETDNWTGAQVEEFVRSLNLHFIVNEIEDPETRIVDKAVVKEVLTLMNYFSVGNNKRSNSPVGFAGQA